jgi:glycosyltransferase involved in cell wall biosynthesis
MKGTRLLLVTDAVGGVWTYSLELARALLPLGVETVLGVTGPSPTDEQREAASGIQLVDTGLPLEWLDTNAAQVVRAAEELAGVARSEKADVVQTSSAALLAAGSFDCPCVAVQHSCVATWWCAVRGTPLPAEFGWRRDLVERGLRRASAIIAPTVAFADATARAYKLGRPVHAVHNGRSIRDVRALPQGDFVFTAARLWDEGKNIATLDSAARSIAASFQAAGPIEGPNGASVSLFNLLPVGNLSQTTMAGVLAARPVFASAALYEPFGLSVLEAAQAGCALILSDIPTYRELWDGAAVFVEPRDDRGFAAAANRLLADRAARNSLGDSAREQARQYTAERMAHGMTEIYAGVLEPQLVMGAA